MHPDAPQPMPDDHADNGLPPTPPTILPDDGPSPDDVDHAESVVNSLMSKKSSLSTPVNARSPPTPDPSPPRTTAASTSASASLPFPYPSSRAESFKTAREEPISTDPSDSRSLTPVGERLRSVSQDDGLGLAFERDDNITPTAPVHPVVPSTSLITTTPPPHDRRLSPAIDNIPDREWNTELMRNVTIRRKRKSYSSPRKASDPQFAPVEPVSPTPSTKARRSSSLRQRVEASSNSPHTPSIENFAHSIGWPLKEEKTPEQKPREVSNSRLSTSSVASTVVEAMVIITPPRRTQTLRHSGRNMAYQRDISSPAILGSGSPTTRGSIQPDNVPLHRLVHKRASVTEKQKRASAESDTLGEARSVYSSLSLRQRTLDSSAHTLAHQESVRRILQPAAESLSRHNSLSRQGFSTTSYKDRTSSAPEPSRTDPTSPRRRRALQSAIPARTSSPTPVARPTRDSPVSRKEVKQERIVSDAKPLVDTNKSLPDIPAKSQTQHSLQHVVFNEETFAEDGERLRSPPAALMERVRQLVAQREAEEEEATRAVESNKAAPSPEQSAPSAPLAPPSPAQENSPTVRRGSLSSRGRSGDRRRGSLTQEHTSLSPEMALRPSLDRTPTEESVRRSYEWRRPSDDPGRLSFDRSTLRTEEHAMARHIYAQETPFSQISDTPIEVSEATAVSIFPHNNHSLLVVQQVSRGSSMLPEQGYLENDIYLTPQDHRDLQPTPTPPFVDASETHSDGPEMAPQPTLTFEPSTPPMQIAPAQPGAVDSPLKNPRPPPEPPKINFIPPTPAEELERQLAPGPPKRSTSHPQRRLSLAQRARRYSDNLIPILLARASSNRGRPGSSSQTQGPKGRVPTVNDRDGALHPFWRPRGFWDDFEDSESESDEDETLPSGGDTSDVVDPPKRSNTLTKRLASGIKGSGGFLIGNSLGVERHGTNRRPHRVNLPPNFVKSPKLSAHTASPKILTQSPTNVLGPAPGNRISKRPSRGSLRSTNSDEMPRTRASWRQGRNLPGLKRYQVQYIGLSGVKKKLQERTAEKRREKLRRSIGPRYYVEPGGA